MIRLEHVDCGILAHCNTRCAACSHLSPFTKPYFMELEDAVRDWNNLKVCAHFEFTALVGGEPLLHPNIVNFIRAAKKSGLSDKVCVITNGSLLPKMTEEFWEELQILRISIYGNIKPEIIPLAEERAAKHGFELQAWPYPEFIKQLKSVPDDGVESFRKCEWRKCFTTHLGSFFACPQSIFMPPRFLGHESTDGLALAGLTEEKLQAYLDRVEPFSACSICAASEKISFPWKESHSKAEWLKESTI